MRRCKCGGCGLVWGIPAVAGRPAARVGQDKGPGVEKALRTLWQERAPGESAAHALSSWPSRSPHGHATKHQHNQPLHLTSTAGMQRLSCGNHTLKRSSFHLKLSSYPPSSRVHAGVQGSLGRRAAAGRQVDDPGARPGSAGHLHPGGWVVDREGRPLRRDLCCLNQHQRGRLLRVHD